MSVRSLETSVSELTHENSQGNTQSRTKHAQFFAGSVQSAGQQIVGPKSKRPATTLARDAGRT
jgi:hypothetical protein